MSERDAIIKSLYYHLVLPPRQPDREDHEKLQAHLARNLIQLFKSAALELRNHGGEQGAAIYDAVLASLSTSEAVNVMHAAQQQHLETAFKGLDPSRPLIIHIFQQNAGLLVWRHRRGCKALPDLGHIATAEPLAGETDVIVFEAFESSPRSEAVFSTDGALHMIFPGSACAISASEFEDLSFQSNLARVLCLACNERLPRFSARTPKASTSVIEPRDTANPELITTWLVTVLETIGSTITVSPITKRVKDEVCWSEGAKAPWRRLHFYLVLRVGLRRSFQLLIGEIEGRLHYKLLVTSVLAMILNELQGKTSWDMLDFVREKVCRRMAKLEEECSNHPMAPSFQAAFESSSRAIWQQISALSTSLDMAWNPFKQRSRRKVHPMAVRFAPFRSLSQDMPSSQNRLVNLVHLFQQDITTTSAPQVLKFNEKQSLTTKYDLYARIYHNLVEEEIDLKRLAKTHTYSRVDVGKIRSKIVLPKKSFNASGEMQAKFQEIVTIAKANRDAKTEELMMLMKKRREMEAECSMKTCLFTTTNDFPPRQLHSQYMCANCKLKAELRRQKILIHEHPLPQDLSQAKSIVFELCMPRAFAMYRDATWAIVKNFGLRQELPPQTPPGTILRSYPPLQTCWKTSDTFTIGLASVKKYFLFSHWKQVSLPAKIDDVCLPCAIEPIYFDVDSTFPLRNVNIVPTFSQKLKIKISPKSQFAFISEDSDFTADRNGPPSNKIISSQAKCPAGLSFHEYTSIQSLFSGSYRRWLLILVELGSSNVNFSNGTCSNIISALARQAGPPDSNDSILRTVHQETAEAAFCNQILFQIANRLRVIGPNWRETYCMSMLVNLLLHILTLCPTSVAPAACKLLETARNYLGEWMITLSDESRQSLNIDTTRICSRYTLWTALVCRRTFQIYIQTTLSETSQGASIVSLDEFGLRIYVIATVSLQQSIRKLTDSIYFDLHEAIVRDIRLASNLSPLLSNAFRLHPTTVADTLYEIGLISESQKSQSLRFLSPPHNLWIEMVLLSPVANARTQVLYLHILAGHLLIDNTPQGKLSEDLRKSPILDELFGETNLYAVSSGLPGMKYRLTIRPYGNEIHVGTRNGFVVVCVFNQGRIWEILDRTIFHAPGLIYADLPHALIHDCLPFFDLQSQVLELRRKAGNLWRLYDSDWRLSMHDWRMTRSNRNRTFTLVNYHGRLYGEILDTFRDFEDFAQIIVYQPSRGPLEVELRRLELKFFINQRFLFESQKLGCEIAVNQDAGCLYGLKSALLIQDVKNIANRHVLVPFGKPAEQRRGMHLEIKIRNDGIYGRYTIDTVLGRLSSPAQPRLLYRKALIHALTSFIVPDNLTGRTGTEEAMHTLASGLCQPSFPLEPPHFVDLLTLRDLVPLREFYPKELCCMQKASWRAKLTTTVQHDGYLHLVDQILDLSDALYALIPNSNIATRPQDHSKLLNTRAVLQRAKFERTNVVSETLQVPEDAEYEGRHRVRCSTYQETVFHLVDVIRIWPSRLQTPQSFLLCLMIGSKICYLN